MKSLTFPHVSLLCFAPLLQLPDFKGIIEGLKEVLKLIFGDQAPAWIFPIIGYLLLLAAVLTGLLGLLTILSKIKDLLTDKFLPLFYDKEKARRSARRRKFADHIESELRRLNMLEAWSDYRFAELEAEVDAEGRRRLFGILPSLYRTSNTLRREKSLSKALALSDERLIIVEGDPGSGKSVALRHVAISMATRAMKSRSAKSLIPIYVNLKEIERQKEEAVDRNLIEAFVLKALNRVNDRDIEEFLEEEFSDGMQSGTWFFLFDSFDEIPEILSSTEADKTIYQYANAVSDFLHGLNQCRGVLASRFFHGPKQFGWPRFSILPLSSNRRAELVRRAGLKSATEVELLGQIETGRQEIMSMASNPMFLGLLCEHMRSGYQFPENSHSVFQTYVDSRLTRDEERLYRRFELKPEELRATAEAVAFCMAADDGLGLSPSRGQIEGSAERLQINLDKRFDKILDAITFLKLARTDTSTSADHSKQFTFAHRRFQEYFSTAVVLREPTKVTAKQLLTDARWRETAIVLCQTQTPEALSPFLEEAGRLIEGFTNEVKSIAEGEDKSNSEANADDSQEHETIWRRFRWPTNSLHVLGLLQEGLARRPNTLSDRMRTDVAEILSTASELGITADRKWALDVSGITPASILITLLRQAFGDKSQVLKDSAYKQVARLVEIPSDLAFSIRATLCNMALTRRLRRERTATHAHLARLNQPSKYLAVLRLLVWVPIVDFYLHLILSVVILVSSLALTGNQRSGVLILIAVFIIPLSYLIYWTITVSGSRKFGFLFTDIPDETKAQAQGLLFLFYNFRNLILLLGFVLPFILKSTVLRNADLNNMVDEAIPWLMVWSYIALWAPSALVLASGGKFMNPVWWPLYPILAPIKPIRAVISMIPPLVKDWRLIPVTVLVLVFYGIITLIGFVVISIPYSGWILLEGVIAFFVIYFGVLLSHRFRDLVRWRRWNQSKPTVIDAQELIANVRSYHFEKYRVRFVNFVRTKGLLVASPENEEAIYLFAKELETPPLSKSFMTSMSGNFDKFLYRIFASKQTKQDRESDSSAASRKKSRDYNYPYGVAVLDEVLKLLEQIRASG